MLFDIINILGVIREYITPIFVGTFLYFYCLHDTNDRVANYNFKTNPTS